MTWLTALGLCLAGLVAIIIEFFVPAAGIIGVVGFGSMVAGVVIAYSEYGTLVGSVYLIGVVVVTPLAMAVYFKFFPKSIVGRWLILGKTFGSASDRPESGSGRSTADGPAPAGTVYRDSRAAAEAAAPGAPDSPSGGSDGRSPQGFASAGANRLAALVGASGKAVSPLRPSGTVVIDGRKYSVVTGGEFLDAGETVVVTRVEGNRIKVRKGASES